MISDERREERHPSRPRRFAGKPPGRRLRVGLERLEARTLMRRDLLGLEEVRRMENEAGRYTLVFLAAPADRARSEAERSPEVELTFNWDPEPYGGGRNFGHLAYEVDNVYETCQRLMDGGVGRPLLRRRRIEAHA